MSLTKEELELRKISWDSSLANWSIIADLLDTIDTLEAQTAAMLEKVIIGYRYMESESEYEKRLRALISTDYAARLADRVQQAEHKGWCDALRNVLASLDGYPNAGGDIEMMTTVEKIVQQAVREEAEWWGYAHCHAFEADEFNCKLCQRLAAHRVAAKAPFPADKHAKPDILDNKYTEWPLPSEDKQ